MKSRKMFLLGVAVCGILLTACAEKEVPEPTPIDAIPLVEDTTTLPVSGTEDTVENTLTDNEPTGPTELPNDLVPNDQ
ncbi:MAG: hypothetical protein WC846_05005 [Candidatus Gracilibacteria bacterium]|jgi:hypothetical protein